MSLKIVALTVLIFSQTGTGFRLDKGETVFNENTATFLRNVFKGHYPEAAVNKYLSVVRQQYSKKEEEKNEGNFEAVLLMVEGALHQTTLSRILSSNFDHYDVRSALKRLEEADNEDSWEEITEEKVEKMKAELANEFPREVVKVIGDCFTKLVKAKTQEERKIVATDLIMLSMDGAKVVTDRAAMIPTEIKRPIYNKQKYSDISV